MHRQEDVFFLRIYICNVFCDILPFEMRKYVFRNFYLCIREYIENQFKVPYDEVTRWSLASILSFLSIVHRSKTLNDFSRELLDPEEQWCHYDCVLMRYTTVLPFHTLTILDYMSVGSKSSLLSSYSSSQTSAET
jgi:hypothetical protein